MDGGRPALTAWIDLFGQAKRVAPAIVVIDELDAIGRARGGLPAGGYDEREPTLNRTSAGGARSWPCTLGRPAGSPASTWTLAAATPGMVGADLANRPEGLSLRTRGDCRAAFAVTGYPV